MPATAACRLLIDPPASGGWNMAVDEVLLNSVAQSSQPTLRFYQWEQPTLSLGYFQQFDQRATHSASVEADVVRRLSGGGAILHDRELTYSLFLPETHNLARDTQQLYNSVHREIIRVINEFFISAQSNWQAQLCQQPPKLAAAEEPFLCFQRRSPGDILLAHSDDGPSASNPKIVGSAQRRRNGVVLQHGSILLSRSPLAPELAGISELAQTHIEPERLIAHLKRPLANTLCHEFDQKLHTTKEVKQVEELKKTKYENSCWNQRR